MEVLGCCWLKRERDNQVCEHGVCQRCASLRVICAELHCVMGLGPWLVCCSSCHIRQCGDWLLEFGSSIHLLLTFDIVHDFKSMREVVEGINNGIFWRDRWLHDMFVFEEDGVKEASVVSSLDKNDVYVKVFSITDEPAVCGMLPLCATAIMFDK